MKKRSKMQIPKAIDNKPLLATLLALIGGSICAYYKVAYPENVIFKFSFGLFILIGSISLLAWREK